MCKGQKRNCVKQKLYNLIRRPLKETHFFENIQKNLSGYTNLQIFKLSKLRGEYESPVMVPCKFGQVPKGCVLLYQQPVVQGPDITPITSDTTHPELLLPQLKKELLYFSERARVGIIPFICQLNRVRNMSQSESSDWVRLRKLRLTASQQFKQVHQRQKDFEELVENFMKSQLYQSAAIKYGLEKTRGSW